MPHHINLVVCDDVWRLLKEFPANERSRVVNQALLEWARRRCRHEAVAEMDRLRRDTDAKVIASDEIVRSIRADREHGHR